MTKSVKHIVIVGGGTAGWITAGTLAAEHLTQSDNDSIQITLVESPNVNPIGVGEGTWPSMRETLKLIGVSEADFLTECDASFKQGSHFIGWRNNTDDSYHHPFTLPESFHNINLADHWLHIRDKVSFETAVSFQSVLCFKGLAPKQITTPEYSFIANYGYHLDAGKFGEFLKSHCTKKLGVKHILADVKHVVTDEFGYVSGLDTAQSGLINGDLFIDCTGTKGLLINETMKESFVSRKSVLFNDSALAVQVPYSDNQDINSATNATAQQYGWIWDIGLQTRRGVGHVFSSNHCSDNRAEAALSKYVSKTSGCSLDSLNVRKLSFDPGHRAKFWSKNVLAIGMSAGFIEPLEASAIALIELSAKYLSKQLPKNREMMEIVADRFNKKFLQRWDQIIDFLKLHYVLSERRDTDYWRDATDEASIPEELATKLKLWQHQSPYNYDSTMTDELFPSASYQYVYYGMGGMTSPELTARLKKEHQMVNTIWQDNINKTNQLLNVLPTNRQILEKIKTYGLSKV